MKKHVLAISTVFLLTAALALAQSPTRFLSIPSSSFTPRVSGGSVSAGGYHGNESGTARLFDGSFTMFAPVNLPSGAAITSMRCGGQAPHSDLGLIFTLRRNEPQQANVDIATVMTTLEGTGFQFVETSSITSPVVDNARFNYYVVAELRMDDIGRCPDCAVGFCRIGYTAEQLTATTPSTLHEQNLDFEGFTVERGVYKLKPGGWEFRPQADGSFMVARGDNDSGGIIEPCECSLITGGSCSQASSEDEFGNIVEIWCVDDGCGFCVGGITADPDAVGGKFKIRLQRPDRLVVSNE